MKSKFEFDVDDANVDDDDKKGYIEENRISNIFLRYKYISVPFLGKDFYYYLGSYRYTIQ